MLNLHEVCIYKDCGSIIPFFYLDIANKRSSDNGRI